LACRNQAGKDIFTDGPQIQPARPVDGENGTTKYAEGAKREAKLQSSTFAVFAHFVVKSDFR
jgi:hypothetical protein